MSERSKQIAQAMNGRQAAQVNDNALRDAVRSKLIDIAQEAGRPLDATSVSGIVAAVLRSASNTIIFEAEVPIALEMGAAGELEHEGRNINQTNCAKWIVAYACCGDRRAAQESISLGAARDRARADAVTADAQRRTFEAEGLMNAWRAFIEEGEWSFREGFGAVLYDRIGKGAITALLNSERIAKARLAAFSSVRRDYPYKYRTAPDTEVEDTAIFKMHAKAHLARAYFETLRERSLDITFNPTQQCHDSHERI
ncbi:MAG: hypothetical protein K6A62_04590 [Bacteroidales bacterium]|nr:hypothetical protein [Bacteroidales bacterium]